MSTPPLSQRDRTRPADVMKNDIPAETDDLELGTGDDGAIENAGSDPDSELRRTGGSPDDPHGGRH